MSRVYRNKNEITIKNNEQRRLNRLIQSQLVDIIEE